jgi:ribose/xylose/arabinose/galactoside ABC-type transport system permease subunit
VAEAVVTEEVSTPGGQGGGPPAQVDERLSHRGPIQRLLVRPEIGALIGTTAIWFFFWATADVFGTAAGTANYLDVAAKLGIMAVAVSLLMIGGEFDLSSGAMTGATAMLVILLSKQVGELGGAGLNLTFAVPLSLAFALTIGWFNGTVVDKTKLPSFIVTLGSYFVLIGAKLSFAKLFTSKVVVEGLDRAHGYDFWRAVFAASWIRNNHLWESRDDAWTALVIAGVALIAAGVLEMSYQRAANRDARGLIALVVGLLGAGAAFVGLLQTDGTTANFVLGALVGVGILVATIGWGVWRYEPLHRKGAFEISGSVGRLLIIGLACVVAAIIVAAAFDSDSQNAVGILVNNGFSRTVFMIGLAVAGVLAVLVAAGKLPVWSPLAGIAICAVPAIGFLMTRQTARAVIFVALAVAGLIILVLASNRAAGRSASAGLAIELLTALVVALLAFFVRSESTSQKFRTELFTVMLLIALALLCSALMGYLFGRQRSTDVASEKLGRRLAVGGVMAIVLATLIKALYSTSAENAAAAGIIRYRVSIFWFLLFAVVGSWLLVRTQFGNWTFAVGGNKEAARAEGVPAARTKTTLFMLVSGAAWLSGMLTAFRLNSVQADVGNGEEFEYIIAAVVGGNLLTGGYGSAAGGAIGSLIMSMSTQGIPFAGWNSNWRFLFLGVILLLAVAGNNYVRRKAEQLR